MFNIKRITRLTTVVTAVRGFPIVSHLLALYITDRWAGKGSFVNVIKMESANKVEAERCIERAMCALQSGKTDYARKLALKSLRLCNTPEGIGKY
jgi:hypothetical protein